MIRATRTRLSVERPAPVALAIRFSVLAFAGLAVLLVPQPTTGLVVLTVVGAVVAAVLPANAGAVLVLSAVVLAWVVSYGTDATPPLPRTVLFAVATYLLHSSTALAGSVPLAADVRLDVVASWAIRCVPGGVVAVVAGVGVSVIGRVDGSLTLDVAGVLGVLATAGAGVWLARRLAS